MMTSLDRRQVLALRYRAQGLAERSDGLARACFGGLQDSAPRSASIALHARAAGVGAESWEDASLAQAYAMRLAVWLFPRADHAVFTLGRLPRDPVKAAAIEALADAVLDALDGRSLPIRVVARSFPGIAQPAALREACTSGRVLCRWDARDTLMVPCSRPDVDEEDARLELARLCIRWMGPIDGARTLGRWIGLSTADARLTWSLLEPELAPVTVCGGQRFIHQADEAALGDMTAPATGTRLLPFGDPYLWTDRDLLVEDPARREALFPKVSAGYLPNAVVEGGRIAGRWARRDQRVVVEIWDDIDRAAIDAEVMSLPVPGTGRMQLVWGHLSSLR